MFGHSQSLGHRKRSFSSKSWLQGACDHEFRLRRSQGRPDASGSRDVALAHLRDMVAATDLPMNADFENGYALDAAGVAESVRLAIETGVAGLSIQDSTGDASNPLYPVDTAVERIRCGAQRH